MIILSIIDMVFNLITAIFTTINLPSLSSAQITLVHNAIDSCMQGVSIISFFGGNQVFSFFVLLLSVETGYRLYTFVMWVIKKLPVSSE